MTTTQQRFIQPLDILFLRDNHLFGGAGDSSRSLMPPWPSVFAGALRSRMLADSGARVEDLKQGALPAPLDAILGTPEQPGSFMLGEVTLAANNRGHLQTCHPLPADIVVTGEPGALQIHRLQPQALPEGLASSAVNLQLPILRLAKAAKPVTDQWLNQAGWQAHLRGEKLDANKHLIATSDLWASETRLGIALDAQQRSAAPGKLYTSDAIAMNPNIGFCVTVHDAGEALPQGGLLRLGGDGRAASIHPVKELARAEPDWDAIQSTGRFRLILTSPGIFPQGDGLPGVDGDGQWQAPGLTAQRVSQAVPRHQVISGWDLHTRQPKTAQRCVPAGSVYWFENFTGELDTLRKLSKTGLWDLSPDNCNPQRRAEGFNRAAVANA